MRTRPFERDWDPAEPLQSKEPVGYGHAHRHIYDDYVITKWMNMDPFTQKLVSSIELDELMQYEFIQAHPHTMIVSRDVLSFMVPLDIMKSLAGRLGGQHRMYSTSPLDLWVQTGDALVRLYRRAGSSDYKKNELREYYVSVAAKADEAERIADLVEEVAQAQTEIPQLQLWHMTKNGPSNTSVKLIQDDFKPEYYPWLPAGYLEEYLASRTSILFMKGPPGTGKTSVLRNFLISNKLKAMATYDEVVLNDDALFIHFISQKPQVMVVEDADNILKDRERSRNNMVSRFLNFSDGLAKYSEKKMVFTTNLHDFNDVDAALLRPGRCFGILEARELTIPEAEAAADAAGLTFVPQIGKKEYTLAEILNPKDYHVKRKRAMGF